MLVKKLLAFCSFLFLFSLHSQAQIVETFTSSGTFTAPAGVTFVTVECWGAGGAGGATNSKQSSAGGGAGGAYTKGTISVTPGSTYSYTVGSGGSSFIAGSLNGNSGGSTWFGSQSTILAVGGTGGLGVTTGGQNSPAASAGATAPVSGNVGGTINYYGGNGGNGSASPGISGGGGSSAGTASNGVAANGINAGTAVAGGGAGGSGVTGDNKVGGFGSMPGGGGGGATNTTGQNTTTGGTGGSGQIRFTYCVTYTISNTSAVTPVCGGSTSSITLTSTAINMPVDVYTVTYNVSGANTATGLTATMNVTSAGSGSFTTAALANAGNSTITITNLSTNNAGCNTGITANNTTSVTVYPTNPITANASPSTQTVCRNAAATQLSVTASGTGLTYQWYKSDANSNSGGVMISGATAATYTPPTATAGTAYYYVVVTSNCGTATSSTAAVVVNASTAISTQPTGAAYCQGSTPSALSVTASGTGTLSYQWYQNTTNNTTGGTAVGTNSNTYTPTTATAGTLYYYVVATGSCGTATSTTATIVVNAPTAISSQPAGATYCQNVGATALSITASGSGTLSYQWYRNTTNSTSGGTAVGTNSNTYTPSTSTASTLYYYAVVTGSCGTATSSTAMVVVNAATAISTQPAGATYCQNATAAALSVTASGTGTLSYQWYQNTTNSTTGGTAVGTNSNTYTPSASASGTFYYYVVITGSCGTATSSPAAIVVNAATSVSGQPAGATYCQNTTAAALSVTASGAGTFSYQWYQNTTNSISGGTAVGTNSNTYTPSTSTAGTLYYYAVVTGSCGTATSATAAIVVNAATAITVQPAGATYCQNATATPLSISASGTGTLAYQWYRNTTNSTSGGTAVGTNSNTYTPSASGSGTLYYYVVVSGSCGTAISSAASVVVNAATTISTQPTGATYCQNVSASALTVTASGTGTLSYQWYQNTTNSTSGGTAVGSNSSSYTPATTSAGTFYYYVVATGSCGSATSSPAAIAVNAATAISIQPTGAAYCQNAPATALSVTASGTGTLSYQWYRNASNSTTGGTAVGTNAASYTPVTTTIGTLYYYVLVTGNCGTATSAAAAITATAPTAISSQPAGATYCQNVGATALSITASGSGTLSYQWYRNTTNSTSGGTAVGTNSNTYVPATSTAGTLYYYAVVTGSCGTATSSTAAIVVNAATAITVQPAGASQTVCQNSTTGTLTVGATGTSLSYQWYQNTVSSTAGGTPVGTNSNSYTPSTSTAGTKYYYVVVSGSCAPTSVTSGVSGGITVKATPDAAFADAAPTVCQGSPAGIRVSSVSGGTLQYTTMVSGGSAIPHSIVIASNSSVLLSDVVTQPTTFTLTGMVGTNDCSTTLTSSLMVQVYALPSVTPITGSTTPENAIATGRTITLSNATTGGTWSSSNTSVASIVASSNTPSPAKARVTGLQVGSSVVTYTTAANENGCRNAASLTLQVYDPALVRYRTTSDGNWSTAGWEKTSDNGSSWTVSAAPDGNATNVELRHHTLLDTNYTGTENASLLLSSYNGTDAILEITPNHYLQSAGGVNFNHKNVVVQSSAEGTGAIGTISDGSIMGADSVTVQRFIGSSSFSASRRAWQLITAPVTGVTINNSWQEGAVSTSNPPLDPNPGYGTLITGWSQRTADTAYSHGYDFWTAIAKNVTSIRYYAPGSVSGSWLTLPGEGLKNLNIETYPAYMLFVRGDRSVLHNSFSTTTLRAKGLLKQGSYSVVVPDTVTYMVVGNPYASPIDFEKVYQNSTGIAHQFLVWNSNLGAYGSYQLVDGAGGSGNYTIVPTPFDDTPVANYQYIQSSQAILVQPAKTGNAMIHFSEETKVVGRTSAGLINPFRETAAGDKKLYVNLYLVNDNAPATLTDGSVAHYDAVYADKAERAESQVKKQANFNENLAIQTDSTSLMVEARPEIAKTDTLQLRLWNVTKRGYQLQMKAERFDSLATLHAWLEDRYLGTKEEISLSGAVSSFSFAVTSDSLSWKADRFRIVFQNQGAVLPVTLTSLTAAPYNAGVNVGWTVSNEVNMKGYTLQRSTDGGRTFTAIAAREARNAAGAATASYTAFDASPLKGGDNLYRIRMEEREGGESYSQVVKVSLTEGREGAAITVYPNPVREGKVNLQFNHLPAGTYSLQLYNAAGQWVFGKSVAMSGAAIQTEQLLTGDVLPAGHYTLQITDHNAKPVYSTKVIIVP